MKHRLAWILRLTAGGLIAFVLLQRWVEKAPSRGIPLLVASPRPDCSGLTRIVVVQLARNGSVSLNGVEPVERNALAGRLDGLMRTRFTKLLFVSAAPELPFAAVASLIDELKQHADYVALLTPAAKGNGEFPCFDARLPDVHSP